MKDFSNYNKSKVDYVLEKYNNYEHIDFSSVDEYYNYQKGIILPWESNDLIRRKILFFESFSNIY